MKTTNRMNRALAMLLALSMIFSTQGMSALADELAQTSESGTELVTETELETGELQQTSAPAEKETAPPQTEAPAEKETAPSQTEAPAEKETAPQQAETPAEKETAPQQAETPAEKETDPQQADAPGETNPGEEQDTEEKTEDSSEPAGDENKDDSENMETGTEASKEESEPQSDTGALTPAETESESESETASEMESETAFESETESELESETETAAVLTILYRTADAAMGTVKAAGAETEPAADEGADETADEVEPESELVNLTAEELTIAGATAEASEGYRFVSWTDETGAVVSEEATFIPEITDAMRELESVTFTANFAATSAGSMEAVSANGLIVKAEWDEGTFPEGVQMEVTPVEDQAVLDEAQALAEQHREETMSAEEAAAMITRKVVGVDISFYLAKEDGMREELEPADGREVRVTMELTDEAKAELKEEVGELSPEDSSLTIVHSPDDAQSEVIATTSAEVSTDAVQAEFAVDSFSTYTLIAETPQSWTDLKNWLQQNGTNLDTYTMLKDITVDDGTRWFSVATGKELTLRLNGWKLDLQKAYPVLASTTLTVDGTVGENGGSGVSGTYHGVDGKEQTGPARGSITGTAEKVFEVNGNATLTMKNTVVSGITSANVINANNADPSNITIDSCYFIGNKKGLISNNDTITVTNSFFENNGTENTDNGGALKLLGGSAEISSSVFWGNMASNGGAIHCENINELTIRQSRFSQNEVSSNGGAIQCNTGTLTITGSKFTENEVRNDGGAINYGGTGEFTVEQSEFTQNKGNSGGAVKCNDGTLTIKKSKFTGNEAANDGGAINYGGTGEFTIENSEFNDNKTTGKDKNGGAIKCNGGTLTIKVDSKFTGNEATHDGGAIYYGDSGTSIMISKTTFENNKAGSDGGALNLQGGTCKLDGETIIKGNTAGNHEEAFNKGDGGGIFTWNVEKLEIGSTVTIEGNIAAQYGGGVCVKGGPTIVAIDAATFSGNKAYRYEGESWGEGGGGLAVMGEGTNHTVTINGATFTNNYTAASGGGALINGKLTIEDVTFEYNTAEHHEGGGLTLHSGSATINNGKFQYNKTGYDEKGNVFDDYGDWGGGGIFVSEKATLYLPFKTKITNNHANGYGGGLAGCSTGRIFTFEGKDGGLALYSNAASGTHLSGSDSAKHADHTYAQSSEVFTGRGYQDYFCAFSSVISSIRYDGDKENWTGSMDGMRVDTEGGKLTLDGEPVGGNYLSSSYVMGLTAGNTSDAGSANVEVMDNSSGTHGGGILCNGFIVIGPPEEAQITMGTTLSLVAKKQLANESGALIAPKTESNGSKSSVPTYSFGVQALADESADYDPAGSDLFTGKNDGNGDITFTKAFVYDAGRWEKECKGEEEHTFWYVLYEKNPNNLEDVTDPTRYKFSVTVKKETYEFNVTGTIIYATHFVIQKSAEVLIWDGEKYIEAEDGTYTFSEGGAQKTAELTFTGRKATDTSEAVAFVNTLHTGSLEVTKAVEGDNAVSGASYKIRVTAVDDHHSLNDTLWNRVLNAAANVGKGFTAYKVPTGEGDTATEKIAGLEFTITAGQTVTVEELPLGIYQVYEVSDEGAIYTAEYSVGSKTTDQVQVTKDNPAQLTVTNVYPDNASMSLTGTKAVQDGALKPYSFKLSWEQQDGLSITGVKDGTLTVDREATNGSFRFDGITFTKAGTYTLTVKEVVPTEDEEDDGIEYDPTTYTVSVTVAKSEKTLNYEITAVTISSTEPGITELTYGSNTGDTAIPADHVFKLPEQTVGEGKEAVKASFINRVKRGSLAVTKNVTGVTANEYKDAEYTIRVTNESVTWDEYVTAAAAGKAADGTTPTTVTLTDVKSADGKAVIGKEFAIKAGVTVTLSGLPVGSYTVEEIDPDGQTVLYEAAITGLTEGKVAVEDEKTATVTVTNSYPTPDTVSLTLEGDKTLSGNRGKAIGADEFSFVVVELTKAEDGTASRKEAATGTTKADGTIEFTPIKYSYEDVGEHTYEVSEKVPEKKDPTISYDMKARTVVVSVSYDKATGKLKAEILSDKTDALSFENKYSASGSLALSAKKTLTGTALKAGQFHFELKDEKGAVLQTAANGADGSVSFDPIAYTQDDIGKTFTYTVSEKNEGAKGVTYDTTVYTVTVKAEDSEVSDGTLAITKTVKDAAGKAITDETGMTFANMFAGSVTLAKLSVNNKVPLSGAEFRLYRKDGTQYTDQTYTTGKDGRLSVKDLPEGEYYFVETKAPAGYVLDSAKQYPFEIRLDAAQANVDVTLDVTNTPEETKTETKLTVTKEIVYNNELWNAVDETFYVALFGDEALTNRLTDVKAIEFRNSNTSSAEFTKLDFGTYYVAETTADGTPINLIGGAIPSGEQFSVDFHDGSTATLTKEDGTEEIHFRNVFMELPTGFYREGTLTVTKELIGADGQAKESNETFYAGIFSDAAHTQLSENVSQNIVALALNGGSSASADVLVSVPQGGSTTLYVTEVDAQGRPVEDAASFAYEVTVDGGTVTMDEQNLSAEAVITNREREEEESETEEESQTETETEKKTAPKTGDDTPLGLYLGLLLAAALLSLSMMLMRRRRRD